uniref:Uncharacterized protein n=1 Tax=Arundo donax TaxID=35708 RepID=A0A0A8ZVR2_ARUDO
MYFCDPKLAFLNKQVNHTRARALHKRRIMQEDIQQKRLYVTISKTHPNNSKIL